MEFVSSQIDSIRWLLTPVGIVTVLLLTGVMLSGLPGAILLKLEGMTLRRTGNAGREKISA